MKNLSSKLTYANVVSTICLFLLLGGGAAFAASNLGKNSVGTKQLKKNAVTAVKVKDGAVSTAKLAPGAVSTAKLGDASVKTPKLGDDAVTSAKLGADSVNGGKVADNSLTGADINQSTLNAVRASNITTVAIDSDANCTPSLPAPAGISTQRLAEGACLVTFPFPVSSCYAQATANHHNAPAIQKIAIGARGFQLLSYAKSPNSIEVLSYLKDEINSAKFDLTVIC